MGHSSIQVTADIYTHLEQEDSLHVADKLNEYLSGKSENSVKSSQKVVKLAIWYKKRSHTARFSTLLCGFSGAPPGTRTLGPLIKSQLLYQLS